MKVTFPYDCPVCENRGELDNTGFDYVNGIKDEFFVCAHCDSEWTVNYVLIEKLTTVNGLEGNK
jgi:hypothetical protein